MSYVVRRSIHVIRTRLHSALYMRGGGYMSYVHASIVYCTCVSVCARTHTLTQNCTQLFMVDLAGSETVKKTGAEGQTLKEAQVSCFMFVLLVDPEGGSGAARACSLRVLCDARWPSRAPVRP
jgi:hypothetical protein